MNQNFTFSDSTPQRVDVWLSGQMAITRSQVQKLMTQNAILVNDVVPKKAGQMLEAGDIVKVLEKQDRPVSEVKTKIKAKKLVAPRIVSETADYVVIDKPAGLPVHPEQHETTLEELRDTGTVAAWVVTQYPAVYGVGEYSNRPGIVHRLDKDTSGLMVIAKTQAMFDLLKEQFKDRTVKKKYVALAHGHFFTEHGLIDFKIARAKDGRMAARPNIEEVTLKNVDSLQDGRDALTEFSVVKEFVNYTLLDVTLHTGRTHQIRVHMFAYNHPLVGDPLYFNKKTKRDLDIELNRVFLHAGELSFTDLSGETVAFTSPLPPVLVDCLAKLKPALV